MENITEEKSDYEKMLEATEVMVKAVGLPKFLKIAETLKKDKGVKNKMIKNLIKNL